MFGNHNLQSNHTGTHITGLLFGLIAGAACFISAFNTQAAEPVINKEATASFEQYVAAKEAGNVSLATKHILKYSELTNGENSPKTIKLMHHYGKLLHEEYSYKEAIEVLLTALERSTITNGPYGEPAFDLNMAIAYAYSKNKSSMSLSTKYFDQALEVLRETRQHESIKYVTTLVSIVADMMRDGGLKGDYTSTVDDFGFEDDDEFAESTFYVQQEYSNYFHLGEAYLKEAEKLAIKLNIKDEYLTSKIAIAMAKLKVSENR